MDSNLPSLPKLERVVETGVTWKSVLTTIALIPFSFYWIIAGEIGLVGYALNTYAVPFYNVVFTLFLLMGGNLLVKQLCGRSFFSSQELLIIYTLLSVSCALPSITLMTILVTTVGHAFWFDTPENEWRVLFWDALPTWLTIQDRSMLSGYYLGESSLYTIRHLTAWLRPALFWSGFMVMLMVMMLCLNIILRRQWAEHERLAYPIAQLPLEMTQPQFQFFRNRKMWAGFSIAAVIEIVNGLNFLQPAVPLIPIREKEAELSLWLTRSPWNMIGTTYLHLRLFLLGLSFLLPLDLSFSTVFFYWVRKAQIIGCLL